jgi:hypothetical protein
MHQPNPTMQPDNGVIDMSAETTLSRQVAEETPGRVLTFLRAVGLSLPLRTIFAAHGYTSEEHQLGWKLLHAVSGYSAAFPPVNEEAQVRGAVAELGLWSEPGFRRVHAALGRLHPQQDAFVFNGLTAATGASAVLAVATFLDRLDHLEGGVAREATREADHAALATLAARGITTEERTRLGSLVKIAQRFDAAPDNSPCDERISPDLLALRAWYLDWSQTARAVIKRRDHLIRLGLARRKRPG